MWIAERLGIDPVIVLDEPDPERRAVRVAAAQLLYEDDDEKNKKQKQESAQRRSRARKR